MREGEMDPGLYDFRPYRDRAKVQWPGGKTVAVNLPSGVGDVVEIVT